MKELFYTSTSFSPQSLHPRAPAPQVSQSGFLEAEGCKSAFHPLSARIAEENVLTSDGHRHQQALYGLQHMLSSNVFVAPAPARPRQLHRWRKKLRIVMTCPGSHGAERGWQELECQIPFSLCHSFLQQKYNEHLLAGSGLAFWGLIWSPVSTLGCEGPGSAG